MPETKPTRKIVGLKKFSDPQGGYFLWIPANWETVKTQDRGGVYLFTPAKDRLTTYFSSEKQTLEHKVSQADLPVLKEGFLAGIRQLEGIEIDHIDETEAQFMFSIDSRFRFIDSGQVCMRWMRLIYSGNSLLILSAHAESVEMFELYEPIFFNIMSSTSFI